MLLLNLLVASAIILSCPSVLATGIPDQVPQIGNGFFATFINGSTEYVAGIFSGAGTHSTRAPFPPSTRVFPTCFLDRADVNTSSFVVDYAIGAVNLTANCAFARITVRWVASRAQLGLVFQQFTCASTRSNAADCTNVALTDLAAGAPMPSNGGQQLAVDGPVTVSVNDGAATAQVTRYTVQTTETPAITADQVAVARLVVPALLPPNGTFILISTRVSTGGPFAPAWQQQQNVTASALLELSAVLSEEAVTPGALLKAHVEAWSQVWRRRIVVDSPTVGPVADGAFWSILCSVDSRVPFSTSPGGLPTDGYNGHSFWDQETWIFPTLMLFNPSLVRGSALEYRLQRAAGALDNARSTVSPAPGSQPGSNTGAAFPWESALTGYNVCPWAQGAESELHITADIVNAWELYFTVTNDTDFLARAAVLLTATADFWVSRSTYDAATGAVHINGVTPPDEYHFGNDSAYTNAAVRRAVAFTIKALQTLEPNNTPMNLQQWQRLVDNIAIPYSAEHDYHPEFAGYAGDTVKQADVALLSFPLNIAMETNRTARNDLEYYAPRTDPNGPAMTWGVFAITYLQLDDVANGFDFFVKSFVNNSFPPYYQWSEVAGGAGCPNFLTGAGGFLQTLWAGLLGMRVTEEGISFRRISFPTDTTAVHLRGLAYLGSELTLRFSRVGSAQNENYALIATLEKKGSVALRLGGKPLRLGVPSYFNVTASSPSLPLLLTSA